MQNGLNVEVELYDALANLDKGPPSIISAALHVMANLVVPNVVEHGKLVGHISFMASCLLDHETGPSVDRSLSASKSQHYDEFS
jgi:hypothetical protein